MLLPHQIAVDGEGALYVANYNAGQVDKFVPKPKRGSRQVGGPATEPRPRTSRVTTRRDETTTGGRSTSIRLEGSTRGLRV